MNRSIQATAQGAVQELNELEAALKAAWTGANSNPFLAEAPLDAGARRRAEEAISSRRLTALFGSYPTLAIWGLLTPLARHYSADREVYRHIGAFTCERFDDNEAREDLKLRFRRAARALGLPVSGNHPSDLFFPPLGPAHAHHDALAQALVSAAMSLGPPATEDTPSARRWQRIAVETRCLGLARLQATIRFDQSAWIATRFEAWRRGELPIGDGEAHLFAAYDQAGAIFGQRRSDLVGPPRLYWTGRTLGFEAERSSRTQSLRLGAAPTPLASGGRVPLPLPWRERVTWNCGGLFRELPAAPGIDQVLVFDEASGALLARIEADATVTELPAERCVVLARRPFRSPSFGPAIQAPDPACFIAWTLAGEALAFDGRPNLLLGKPREAALTIEAPVIGRSGSRTLFVCDGHVKLRLEPGVGGSERIIRALAGDTVHYATLDTGADGEAIVSFAKLGLALPGDPVQVRFEALAPGAVGDRNSRAELAATAWIWPGLKTEQAADDVLPAPANFVAARSAGLWRDGDRLHIDHRVDVEAPILGLRDGEAVREFQLAVRGDRLWHVRVASGDQQLVPRGARLVFGHANRHDTLLIRSGDRDADLLVLGQPIKRPFVWRTRFEIPASMLEPVQGHAEDNPEPDSRILLRRADGRSEVLAGTYRRSACGDARRGSRRRRDR
jgi:hypothetical protein